MFSSKPVTHPLAFAPRARVAPKMIRTRGFRTGLPTVEGRFWWTEWDAVVQVVKRGGSCYVTPPTASPVEVRITNNIAGEFYPILTEL